MKKETSRRRFLQLAGQGIALGTVLPSLPACSTSKNSLQPIGSSESGTQPAKLVLNVRDYGVTGDGKSKETLAIQQTIDRCWVLGGGEVLFPAGDYLTGGLALKSNVTLRLENGASLIGTPDFSDYPVAQVRWEGKWVKGHVGLIHAFDATNIGVVGPGKIIGNPALGGRPTAQYPLRHPALIEPINCSGIRLEDFSSSYRLMWSIHPTYCDSIFINNLTIRSTGGNGDGIDIDSCKQVRIENCDIATGDDCISLKSGRGMEGYSLLRTTEDVQIRNCTFADSIFACIGIGSETSGGIRNVVIENCRFTAAKTHAIYIKSRPGRGAFIEDIICRNLDVSGMEGGFLRLNLLGSGLQDQHPVPGKEGIPTVRNFAFSHIRVVDVPVLVDGTAVHPDKPLQGLTLEAISGTCKKGISLANADDVKIRNIDVTGFSGPLLSTANVNGSGLKGAVAIEPPKLPEPVVSQETYRLK